MPTIVHFEVPSDNLERTKRFYTELFGWKMEKMQGMGQREYWTFSTSSSDRGGGGNNSNGGDGSGSGTEQRTISGGMMDRQMPQEPIWYTSELIQLQSIQTRLKDLEAK